jgi:Putative metal-binding motif
MKMMTRVVCALTLLSVVAACKKSAPSGEGTILLTVQSTKPVDRVIIKAFNASGQSTMIDFDTAGKDITKEPIYGQVNVGVSGDTEPVLFVGLGYLSLGNSVVTSGRTVASFEAGKRASALLNLEADIVDVDQDGYAQVDDCDDRNASVAPFFTEKCDNGVDDDCDGSYDEECPCVSGDQRACYTGPTETRNVGQCRDGYQDCTGAKWGPCQYSVTPQKQFCNNGQDGNCDGSIDEGCPCSPGSQRFCFGKDVADVGAPASALNLRGACRAGTQACVGSSWGGCDDAVYATAETCNGLDDNCDGALDEGFDSDGDGFTGCGTKTTRAAMLCAGVTPGDGILTSLIDCDDANPSRHPCQVDRCGDMNLDDDCDGTYNECQTAAGSCGDFGYFAGWFPKPDASSARNQFECKLSSAPYGTLCNPDSSGACLTAALQCPSAAPTAGGATQATRQVCKGIAGCSGTTTAGLGGNLNGEDPFNDCGTISCDTPASRVYAGDGVNAGQIRTGWLAVGSGLGASFQCRVAGPVSAVDSRCFGGSCDVLTNCKTFAGTPVTSSDPAATISQACRRPTGSSGSPTLPTPDLGNTCTTTAAGVSVPPTAEVVPDGSADPLGRCGATLSCRDHVNTAWSGTTTRTCNVFTGDGSVNRCQGGACDAAGTPSAPACVSANATTQDVQCTSECYVASSCATPFDPVSTSTDFCYNKNGGTPGGSSCAVGQTCYSSTAGRRSQDAACTTFNLDEFCGRNTRNCGGAADCREGYVTGSGAFDTASGSNNGFDYDCLCPTTTTGGGRTAGMFCNGTCCAPGEVCLDSGCTAAPPGRVPCGNGGGTDPLAVSCDAQTHYCDTTNVVTSVGSGDVLRPPFACRVRGSNEACNQRLCGASQYCSNLTSSICSSCTVQNHCGTSCADCGALACRGPSNSACTTPSNCSCQ